MEKSTPFCLLTEKTILITKTFDVNGVSIKENSYETVNINVSLDGYTPIGVVGFEINSPYISIFASRIMSINAKVLIMNFNTSSIVFNISLIVLYQKNYL